MERKQEVVIILQSLLIDCDEAIDKGKWTSDKDKIIKASKSIVRYLDKIQSYLKEIDYD